MESKVIEKCFTQSQNLGFRYDNKYIVKKQSGSGNNWANGYFNHGPTIEEDFINKLSSLINEIYVVDSIIVINSLAGGTGSGLGSYINTIVKENYPHIVLATVNIWPSSTGEVIVNSYNTLLSISESYKNSDLMFVFENEEVYDICRSVFKMNKIQFEHYNSLISKRLLAAFLPIIEYKNNICNNSNNNSNSVISLSNIKQHSSLFNYSNVLCQNPKLKMCKIVCLPEIPDEQIKFTNNSWSALIKLTDSCITNFNSLVMIFRGRNSVLADCTNKSLLIDTLNDNSRNIEFFNSNNLEIISQQEDFYLGGSLFNNESRNNHTITKIDLIKGINEFRTHDKHLTSIFNSDFLNKNLEDFINRACDMYSLGVFTHHYYKYGLESEDFLNAFRTCNQIIYDYKNY